ncbi:MAG: segregation/condensation protein A [Betaproteobacteria bacterium AqS2]|uniref:Segregation and condensation protein A n=1 Tax=Candidatus Amphirhobacter heronislandensis TaxID=1732024 RepID=A0A930XW04_9GAMM|nr:segregation/condensation protein A [Betaproteobacteria bacterium AqS2]
MSDAIQPALLEGQEIEAPKSLYIPPAALRVMLASFEGPLDLLHYLIRRNNMDILDIPMVELTQQYLEYVERIVASELELVADYLLMAATLIDIKARLLTPQPKAAADDDEVEDPRAALVERLLLYSRIKGAAAHIAASPIQGRDCWAAQVVRPRMPAVDPRISCRMLLQAQLRIDERAEAVRALTLQADGFTVREAMAHVMAKMREAGEWAFARLLGARLASRARASAVFVAALQLAKDQLVRIDESGGGIVIRARRD